MNEVYIFLVILTLVAALVTLVGCTIKLISLTPENERVTAYKAATLLMVAATVLVISLYGVVKFHINTFYSVPSATELVLENQIEEEKSDEE